MANYLCIDWGNTRVKAAIFEDDKILNDYNFSENEALEELINLAKNNTFKAAILCSVVNHPVELNVLLAEHTKLFVLDDNLNLPIMNAYANNQNKAWDRLALVVAAYNLFPDNNNLVISVGTTITYNFISNNRTFRGGNITPGIQMRLQSLHEHTHQLPLVNRQGEEILLGYDTATNIRGGVIFGMLSEIDGMINLYTEKFGTINAVLTGGDAGVFANRLKNKTFADPLLLLKGLNIILKNNAH